MPGGACCFQMHEDDVERVIAHPRTMIGSDGLPHDRHPHPRLWGAFPRVFAPLLARAQAVLARTGGAQDDRHDGEATSASPSRGVLRAGAFADVVVFDPARIADTATFRAADQHQRRHHGGLCQRAARVCRGRRLRRCGRAQTGWQHADWREQP